MLNMKGEVEMDALVMDGRTLASGAVSAVRNVANPIQLARLVMDKVPGGGAVKGVCPSSGARAPEKSRNTRKWFEAPRR